MQLWCRHLVNVFIRLHRMHEMQTIVTDNRGVCPSICQFDCQSLSRIHRMTPHSEADLRIGFTVWGHSVQPLPNDFGLLFNNLKVHSPVGSMHYDVSGTFGHQKLTERQAAVCQR